jgi:hypothetical protein
MVEKPRKVEPATKTRKSVASSHDDQSRQLAGGEDGRQLAVRDPVAQRQQQQDAQRQRNLVQGWHQSDLGGRYAEILRHQGDDRMNVIGVGRDNGTRQGQQDQVPPPQALCVLSRVVPVTGFVGRHPGIPARRA